MGATRKSTERTSLLGSYKLHYQKVPILHSCDALYFFFSISNYYPYHPIWLDAPPHNYLISIPHSKFHKACLSRVDQVNYSSAITLFTVSSSRTTLTRFLKGTPCKKLQNLHIRRSNPILKNSSPAI